MRTHSGIHSTNHPENILSCMVPTMRDTIKGEAGLGMVCLSSNGARSILELHFHQLSLMEASCADCALFQEERNWSSGKGRPCIRQCSCALCPQRLLPEHLNWALSTFPASARVTQEILFQKDGLEGAAPSKAQD